MNNVDPVAKPQQGWKRGVGIAVVGVVLLGAGGWLLFRQQPVEAPPAPPAVAAPEPVAKPAEPPLPSAADLDALVRARLAGASSLPEFAAWLREQDLLRRFVVVVNGMASGESPRAAVAFLAPGGAFQVRQKAGRTFIEKKGYARYDVIGKVVGSLNADVLVSAYQEVRHLAARIHQESAQPGNGFDSTLRRALEQVLAVPVLDGDVEVQARGAGYVYADPSLEGLTAAQKHLLRMGPANLRLIQGKVREVSQRLPHPLAQP
ncbi:MAG TPA: DUF3014 domain-containing protein [Myxococcus sp.]|nr:DUF3014 domain-containing protein [Myxococcus sp.]